VKTTQFDAQILHLIILEQNDFVRHSSLHVFNILNNSGWHIFRPRHSHF